MGSLVAGLLRPGAEEDYEAVGGVEGANKVWVEERKRRERERMKDPAVLVNIPKSPSAQAYEVAQNRDPKGDYFRPEMPDRTGTPGMETPGTKTPRDEAVPAEPKTAGDVQEVKVDPIAVAERT
jgi:hypothetical protein